MTRVTAHETAARESIEDVGLTMVRSEAKRMARATFDIYLGDKRLAEGLTCQEAIAAATIVSGLNEIVQESEEETTAEETGETMPTEPDAESETASADSDKMPEEA